MKKIITCLLAFACVIAFGCTCFADGGSAPWYPADVDSFEDFHNENAARVVDDADVLDDDEEEDLTSEIEDLIDKYGLDFVIYTTPTSYDYGTDHKLLAADFYQFNGYGLGDDYSGSVLMICFEEGNRGWYSAARGKARDYFTENNINAIDDSIEYDMKDGEYYDAMLTYVEKLGELYSNGTLEYDDSYDGSYDGSYDEDSEDDTVMHIIIALVIGLIAGAIVAGTLTAGMKKVRIATNADLYIVPGSDHLRVKRDHFLYIRTRRVLRDDDHKKGGGGHSSFSGGFSSSGGGSFSGGGRSF